MSKVSRAVGFSNQYQPTAGSRVVGGCRITPPIPGKCEVGNAVPGSAGRGVALAVLQGETGCARRDRRIEQRARGNTSNRLRRGWIEQSSGGKGIGQTKQSRQGKSGLHALVVVHG